MLYNVLVETQTYGPTLLRNNGAAGVNCIHLSSDDTNRKA